MVLAVLTTVHSLLPLASFSLLLRFVVFLCGKTLLLFFFFLFFLFFLFFFFVVPGTQIIHMVTPKGGQGSRIHPTHPQQLQRWTKEKLVELPFLLAYRRDRRGPPCGKSQWV